MEASLNYRLMKILHRVINNWLHVFLYVHSVLSECLKKNHSDSGGIQTHDLLLTSLNDISYTLFVTSNQLTGLNLLVPPTSGSLLILYCFHFMALLTVKALNTKAHSRAFQDHWGPLLFPSIVRGVSWPSDLVHWTQVLMLSKCGFESRPGRSRRMCPSARHLTIIASSFGWDVKL